MHVLVVDDDPDVREVIRLTLEREGVETCEAADGAQALALARAHDLDLVLLDLHLPDINGLDLLADIRAIDPTIYVIVVSGAGSESDRVLGLVSGADDYVLKPFSPRELAARVTAVARRKAGTAAVADVVQYGDMTIDRDARIVHIDGREVELPRREFDLLAHLASHAGRAFSRDELLHAVWTSSSEWQQVSTVTEHVRRLRAKIERDPNNPERIVTVRGTGYRFVAAGVAPTAMTPPIPTDSRAAESLDATVVIVGTTIRFASPSTATLLRLDDPSALIGRDVFEVVAPQSIGATKARHALAAQGHWPRPELITLVRGDGTEVLVEIASAPVIWEGEPASQVTLWDLAGDTRPVRELATGISTEVSDAVIVTSEDLRIQSFNQAAEELYGWREDEVVGLTLGETLGWEPADDTAERQQQLFDLGHWYGEGMQQRRDGTSVRVRSARTVLRDGAGDTVGVISVNRPIRQTTVTWLRGDLNSEGAVDTAIRAGIRRGEFVVHYQPVVRLESGRIEGVEALVRWQHPSRGLLAPGDFIGVAELSGSIVELGQLVLEQACAQAQAWRAAGRDLHLSVNLSARQLADESFAGRLRDVCASTALAPDALWLEVTETSLVQDLEQASAALRAIDALGAHVSIDDFGTGWASLTYLREFPVHALKIDRSFVAGLGTGSRDEAIVSSIIRLGRELGVRVIAEGIERADQANLLEALGCDTGQGYLYGRPGDAGAVELMLSSIASR